MTTAATARIVKGCPATSGDDYQLNVSSLLRHAARTFPEREIVSRNLDGSLFRYDYRRAHERAMRLANALDKLGVKPGDCVGVVDWNTHRFLELYFAVSGIGAVLLMVNPRISAADRIYVIAHSRAKWLFVSDSLLSAVKPLAKDLPLVEGYVALTDQRLDELDTELLPLHSYEDLLREASPRYDWPMIDERSAHSACYTTGTTGKPKGVYYSHRCVYLHTTAVALANELAARDVVLQIAPMYHAQGWGLFFAATMVGAKLVFPGRYAADNPAPLVDLFVGEKVTVSNGAPAIFMPMLEYMRKLDPQPRFPRLRMISGASEPPLAMMKGYQDVCGAEILHGYGATETGPLATINRIKPELDALSADGQWELRKKQGLPIAGIEVMVVGADGQEVPHDGKTVGEVWMRGPWVTTTYHDDPRSAEAFERGYWRSGDAATVDENGYIKVTDRYKDLVKSGGEWISSIDMENALMAHPAVLLAAVVGLPHPKWEERPLALVVLREERRGKTPKEELLAFLADKFAKWQLPDDIAFVASIPTTSVGKFAKNVMREMFRDYYLP